MINEIDKIIEIVRRFIEFLEGFGPIGAILSSSMIVLIPMLPLFPIAGANFTNFGLLGVLYTYMGVVLSMSIVFSFVKYVIRPWVFKNEKLYQSKTFRKAKRWVDSRDRKRIALFYAMPFTPSIIIVFACGLIDMNKEDFSFVVLVGTIGTILFNTYVGASIINIINDPINAVIMVLIIVIAVIISKKNLKENKNRES